jgi:hypothetical protein
MEGKTMQITGTTAVLDVTKELANDIGKDIVEFIDQPQGASSASFKQYINHLMFVDCSPGGISAQGIRTDVDRYFETDGPATCLIGM